MTGQMPAAVYGICAASFRNLHTAVAGKCSHAGRINPETPDPMLFFDGHSTGLRLNGRPSENLATPRLRVPAAIHAEWDHYGGTGIVPEPRDWCADQADRPFGP